MQLVDDCIVAQRYGRPFRVRAITYSFHNPANPASLVACCDGRADPAEIQDGRSIQACGYVDSDGNERGVRLKKSRFQRGIASRETMQRDGNLFIGAVIRKAYVGVNEEGTEAAGASGVV